MATLCCLTATVYMAGMTVQCYGNTFNQVATYVDFVEPCASVCLTSLILLFYLRFPVKGCCHDGQGRQGIGFRKILKCGWFAKRVFTLFAVFVYYIIAYADNQIHHYGAGRYLILPVGLITWFIVLCVANESGPLTWVYRNAHVCGIRLLSVCFFLHAALSNLIEFIIVTVYITEAVWIIFSDDHTSNLAHVLDVLGMTATMGLRYDFAAFFLDMALLTLQKKKYGRLGPRGYEINYRLLRDYWEDWPDMESDTQRMFADGEPERVLVQHEFEKNHKLNCTNEGKVYTKGFGSSFEHHKLKTDSEPFDEDIAILVDKDQDTNYHTHGYGSIQDTATEFGESGFRRG
ncbi:uncharacterized protein [Ptychodera flava]|uniref:uncharacterized protein n=1 Tax=Ptychodera flava TaxID=63121 RepID=UPI00396A6736